MGQGQDVVFREGVHQGEGDVPVVELAEIGIQLDVVADVVHPAHVPLEVEAQPPSSTVGDLGPGGGLLSDHQHVGMAAKMVVFRLLEDSWLQVLIPAVDVGIQAPS